MKFTVEHPDPKFKAGDFIALALSLGDCPKIVVVFAVCIRRVFGVIEHTIVSPEGGGESTGERRITQGTYCLSCQEDVAHPHTGKEWLHKRQRMTMSIEHVDAEAELVQWGLPLLPMADLEYLTAKFNPAQPKTHSSKS